MAFPPATLEDAFTRADGDVNGDTTSVGGHTWAAPMHSGDGTMNVVSSALASTAASQYTNSCINYDFGSDIRISLTIATLETADGCPFNIAFRVPYTSFPATYGGSSTYYEARFQRSSGNDTFTVIRTVAGAETDLTPGSGSETLSGEWSAGDEVAVECYESAGSTIIKIYRKPSGGSWGEVASYTDGDGSRPTSGQKVGFQMFGPSAGSPADWVIDDLGIELYSAGQTLLPDADTAAGGWAAVGTASLWAAASDSSDSTYMLGTAS